MKYDLAIIGAGPAGYVAAERGSEEGMSVILFEKNNLGGVCLNEGCIPTKTLLYSAKIYDNTKQSSKYGIDTIDVSFDYSKIAKRKDKIIRKLVAGIKSKIKNNNVEIIAGNAYILGKKDNSFQIKTEDDVFEANNLIIATGSKTFIPDIPGLDINAKNILTNQEILAKKDLPSSLIIVGGGVIGMEFASIYNSFGVEVTVIEMTNKILGEIDEELSTMLLQEYEKRGVKIILNAKVTEISNQTVYFESNCDNSNISAENILISVGRRPNITGFGLENLGVNTLKGGIKVDDKMTTNIPHVFAAGDVTGFSLLAHTASREAEVIINNLTGKNDRMSYNAIPSVVYTNPELSSVGHTEKTATAQNIKYRTAKLSLNFSGRFVAENEQQDGLCKILINEQDQIIGVHILGNPSGEIISAAAIAVERAIKLDELKTIVFPHPTVSEIFKETLFSFPK